MTDMKMQVYRDDNLEFRWRLKARNGRIIGACGEGYKNESHARKMADKIAYGEIKVDPKLYNG